jgi:nucleoside-triphosphatase THEP1
LSINNIQIYISSYPGVGKTTKILKNIAQNKNIPIFFPISGKVSE